VLIIATLYVVLAWLLFSKLKLVRWGWLSGSVTVAIGLAILGVFLALFNYLTPSGRIVVGGRVLEVTPNVSGEVIRIPTAPNVPVKGGTVSLEIDPKPFQYKISQLEAALVAAQQQAKRLKANYDQATANVDGLTAQHEYNKKRLTDVQKLAMAQALSAWRQQDTQVQVETVTAQLQAAKAAQLNAKIALDSEIGGVNTSVAQLQAQLDQARWELAQTTLRAPADGYVTTLALTVGDRALHTQPAMSFIVSNEITIVGMFSPNGFQTIKPGAQVILVFDNNPGRLYHAKITAVPRGVGEGQIRVSGVLANSSTIGGTKEFPAVISIPDHMSNDLLRLGMPGTATVFSEKAGVIGLLAKILIWISSYTAYL
jgi:multidrug resistance efflux pump